MFIIYKKPAAGSCDIIKAENPNIKWNQDCSYIQELNFDSSIRTPKEPMYF